MKDPATRALDRVKTHLLQTVQAAQAMGTQDRLEASQWLSADAIAAQQLQRLKSLARFAAATTPHYIGLDVATIEAAQTLGQALTAIPILPRAVLAHAGDTLKARQLPKGHFPTGARKSSGTSGQIVAAETTNLVYQWQNALNLRAQLWADRDLTQSIGVIRNDRRAPAPFPEGKRNESWGATEVFPFVTGPSLYLGTASSLEQQWDWLSRKRPTYLMAYPSIIRAFAARAEREGQGPCPLAGISTVGETVDSDLRNDAARYLGAEIHDLYSAEEIGVIAIQCPTCRRYHTQDEAIIVEILDDANKPCAPGSVGRVVVTPLVNYATVLLRYDIGDLTEAGARCSCGRGLQTINRIVGRIRNIFKLADGTTFWPSFGSKNAASGRKVRQYQFRQLDYHKLEVVFALDTPFTSEDEEDTRRAIVKRMPSLTDIGFVYVDEIPREASGKYQEFVCLVA